MAWDPAQYLKFADHRLRPAIDLLNRVDLDAPRGLRPRRRRRQRHAPDQGALARGARHRRGRLGGHAGQGRGRPRPRHHLAAGRPGHLAPGTAGRSDLLQRRAALAARPRAALPRAARGLAPGRRAGRADAAQLRGPSHTSISEAARAGPWRATLEPLLRPAPVADPDFYYGVLAPHAAALDIWETEYLQVLEGADPVKEWTKGTWLDRCSTRSRAGALSSRPPTPRWWRAPTRRARTGGPCFPSGASS